MPSDSASTTHQRNVSADRAAQPEAACAAEPEAARAAEPEAADEAAPAADPDAWKETGLQGQWRKGWFINVSHRVKDTSVLNDCRRLSDLHPLRAKYVGCPSKKPTHLCIDLEKIKSRI